MRSCNVRNTPHKINAVPKKETVNVVCRVRPLSNEERRQAVPKCLDIRSNNVIIRKGNKTQEFSFNEVFSPKSTQHDVYKSCVEPMIHDACAGYSCTLFAYGQTGTGKTFTLEGAKSQSAESTVPHRTADSIDPKAGIIPRAMFHLLKHLSKYPQNRFSVTVSIVELYNEKLIDLLGKDQDIENESRAIKIYEKDGEPTISNVQLEQVTNQEDVFRLLSIAGARRKTAETKMNAQSSRSHCIFRATVNLQQEDNNNMTTGTLFLVDLAGSENIGRSGAKDKRAKEAGNINKSLCSLGRVITSLVEGNKHIPYRESLLTRLLQNSLGGKCKTTMVVCISPSKADYDETMNTLDYGRRAQNIKNSPEICETHNMTLEMSRMQQQLELQTNKNGGVTVTKDRFEELTGKAEAYDQLYNEHELQQSQHQELLEAKEELDLLHKDLKEKYGYESFCRRHLDGISDRQLDQSTMLLNAGEQLLTTIKKLNQIKQQISDMFSKNLKLSQKTKNSIEEKANTCRQLLSKNVDQAITEYKKIISSDEDTRGNEIENLKNISNNNNSEILNLLKNLRTALENYENIGKENFENLSKINKKFEEKIADQKSNFDENFKNLKEGQLDSTVGNIGDQRKQFYEFLTKKGEEFDLFAKALKDSGERFDDKGKVILEKGKTEFLKGLFDMHWFFGLAISTNSAHFKSSNSNQTAHQDSMLSINDKNVSETQAYQAMSETNFQKYLSEQISVKDKYLESHCLKFEKLAEEQKNFHSRIEQIREIFQLEMKKKSKDKEKQNEIEEEAFMVEIKKLQDEINQLLENRKNKRLEDEVMFRNEQERSLEDFEGKIGRQVEDYERIYEQKRDELRNIKR